MDTRLAELLGHGQLVVIEVLLGVRGAVVLGVRGRFSGLLDLLPKPRGTVFVLADRLAHGVDQPFRKACVMFAPLQVKLRRVGLGARGIPVAAGITSFTTGIAIGFIVGARGGVAPLSTNMRRLCTSAQILLEVVVGGRHGRDVVDFVVHAVVLVNAVVVSAI